MPESSPERFFAPPLPTEVVGRLINRKTESFISTEDHERLLERGRAAERMIGTDSRRKEALGSIFINEIVSILEHSVPLDQRSGQERRQRPMDPEKERRVNNMPSLLPMLRHEMSQLFDTISMGLGEKGKQEFPARLRGALAEHAVAWMLASKYRVRYAKTQEDTQHATDWIVDLRERQESPASLLYLQVKAMPLTTLQGPRLFPLDTELDVAKAKASLFNPKNPLVQQGKYQEQPKVERSMDILHERTTQNVQTALVVLDSNGFGQLYDQTLGIPLNPSLGRKLRDDVYDQTLGQKVGAA